MLISSIVNEELNMAFTLFGKRYICLVSAISVNLADETEGFYSSLRKPKQP